MRRWLAFLLLIVFSPPALAAEIDFDEQTDRNLFRSVGFSGGLSWSSNQGISGSGALTGNLGEQAMTLLGQTFDIRRPGAYLELSAFFKSRSPADVPVGSHYIGLHITSLEGDRPTRRSLNAEVANYRSLGLFGMQWSAGGAGAGPWLPFGDDLLQSGRWYQFVSRVENIGKQSFIWDMQLHDYGADGLERLGTVVRNRTPQKDLENRLSDSTLYVGLSTAGESTLGLDNFRYVSGAISLPTSRLEISPVFDVEAVVDGTTTSLLEGEGAIAIGNESSSPAASYAVMEFPLDALPSGARVVSATLQLFETEVPAEHRLRLHGYAGDGVASAADAAAVLPLLNRDDLALSMATAIEIDEHAVTSFAESASHLGVKISNGIPNNVLSINSLESDAFVPKLILDYWTPTAGDFDMDGDVDATDLQIWKGAFNLNQLGDADGDSDSDGRDLLAWQRQLGSKPAVAVAATVPEPGCIAMLAAATTCIAGGSCRLRRPVRA